MAYRERCKPLNHTKNLSYVAVLRILLDGGYLQSSFYKSSFRVYDSDGVLLGSFRKDTAARMSKKFGLFTYSDRGFTLHFLLLSSYLNYVENRLLTILKSIEKRLSDGSQ